MAALQEKQLGQARPGDLLNVSIFSPSAGERGIIRTIMVCNTSAGDALFRIFCDDDGVVYDETTALFWDRTVPPNETIELKTYIAMNNAAGNLAVRTSVISALTFTAFGAIVT